jgi:hypothetical protein
MHGVRRDLLLRQARAVDLPLVEVEIPAGCSNDVYEERMGQPVTLIASPRRAESALDDQILAMIDDYGPLGPWDPPGASTAHPPHRPVGNFSYEPAAVWRFRRRGYEFRSGLRSTGAAATI